MNRIDPIKLCIHIIMGMQMLYVLDFVPLFLKVLKIDL